MIAYALPYHTSGKFQPLYPLLFSEFKQNLNDAILRTTHSSEAKDLDRFSFCSLLCEPYYILSHSAKCAGILWSCWIVALLSGKMLDKSRPKGMDDIETLITPHSLAALFKAKRIEVRKKAVRQYATLLHLGFVCTQRDQVLTSDETIILLRAKVARDSVKHDKERM